MKIITLISVFFFGVATTSFSQQARVKRYTAPIAGTVVLSEVNDKYNVRVLNLEAPAPDANIERKKLNEIKRKALLQYPRQRVAAKQKTTTAPQPLIAQSYLADTSVGIPPDNDLAVSKGNRSVSVVNSFITTHDAQTGQMMSRSGLYFFSLSVGLINTIQNPNRHYRFDPKVIYDPHADRFICIMLNSTNEDNHIVVGFSKTNNPDSAWYFYKFYGNYANDTTWFDYPSIAITPTEFFFTGNMIKFNTSWQAGFKQTVIYQLNKQDGYNGSATLDYQIWDNINYNGAPIRNLYPVKGGGGIYGPEQYFLSNRNFDVQNDTVFLVKLPDTIGSVNTNLTITPLKSNLAYGVPPDGQQKDTFTLATNDARVLGAYREGNEIQFVSTTVHPLSGSAAVLHGKISNFSVAPSLQTSYFMVDTLDFGYPNISFAGNYNGVNHSIISFNYTGANEYAGMGAIYYDGAQFSDLLKVKTGDSTIVRLQGKQQRWGDYMGSQPDWNAIGAVWIEGIYGRKNNDYGNWIAKLVSPFYTSVAAAPQTSAPSKVYPNPAFRFIRAEFELRQAATVDFSIYDIQGKKIDRLLLHRCKQGKNEIQFNIESLAPGTYIVKGVDEKGSEVMSRRFIKQ